jgi:hypothetical protein
MSEGQHLKLQGGPTPKPEGNQRHYRGQDRWHAGHDKSVGAKLQCFKDTWNYEQPQGRVDQRPARQSPPERLRFDNSAFRHPAGMKSSAAEFMQ